MQCGIRLTVPYHRPYREYGGAKQPHIQNKDCVKGDFRNGHMNDDIAAIRAHMNISKGSAEGKVAIQNQSGHIMKQMAIANELGQRASFVGENPLSTKFMNYIVQLNRAKICLFCIYEQQVYSSFGISRQENYRLVCVSGHQVIIIIIIIISLMSIFFQDQSRVWTAASQQH